MTKKTGSTKKTAKVGDLSVRKDSDVKGGSLFSSIGNSVSTVIKAVGEGLTTVARKG